MRYYPLDAFQRRLARQRAEAPAVRSHVREHDIDAPQDGCRYCSMRAAAVARASERLSDDEVLRIAAAACAPEPAEVPEQRSEAS